MKHKNTMLKDPNQCTPEQRAEWLVSQGIGAPWLLITDDELAKIKDELRCAKEAYRHEHSRRLKLQEALNSHGNDSSNYPCGEQEARLDRVIKRDAEYRGVVDAVGNAVAWVVLAVATISFPFAALYLIQHIH